MSPSYCLVTAACNEERYITRTIESVVAQTVKPRCWIIISDCSTDKTDEIVNAHAATHPFITLRRLTAPHARSFAAQARAINIGLTELAGIQWDFVGNIDADVSFEPNYFASLMTRFERNPRLGLGGGVIREIDGSIIRSLPGETLTSVAHAVQFFTRTCHQKIGLYPELPFGGPDTYAEVMAQLSGFEVRSFPDLVVQHHRHLGAAGGLLRSRFRQGLMDHSLGYDPLFQLLKCARRLPQRPFAVGAVARMCGFIAAWLRGDSPSVSLEFVAYLRDQQRHRLRALTARIARRSAG